MYTFSSSKEGVAVDVYVTVVASVGLGVMVSEGVGIDMRV